MKEFTGTRNPLKRAYIYTRALAQVLRAFRRLRPDVVITNTLAVPCGAVAASILRVPHIWYIHEFLEEDHGFHFEFGRRFSLNLVDKTSFRVVANSDRVKDNFSKEIRSDKLIRIYQPVVVQGETPDGTEATAPGRFRMVLIGRHSESKGQMLAVRALKMVRDRGLAVELSLVGPQNNYTDLLRREVEEAGLSDRVEFVPFVEDPVKYFLSADAALMCSRNEAFGRVTVESMKLGVPVIAADSGSGQELVRHDWNGFLFEAGSAESLADQIGYAYENPAKRETVRSNALSWANETFNPEKYADAFERIFRDLARS